MAESLFSIRFCNTMLRLQPDQLVHNLICTLISFFVINACFLLHAIGKQVILCLKPGVAPPNTTPTQIASAASAALGLASTVPVTASTVVDQCKDNTAWQARISIWNEASGVQSASAIASAQVGGLLRCQWVNRAMKQCRLTLGASPATLCFEVLNSTLDRATATRKFTPAMHFLRC